MLSCIIPFYSQNKFSFVKVNSLPLSYLNILVFFSIVGFQFVYLEIFIYFILNFNEIYMMILRIIIYEC